jgi:hypothetical protein
LFAGGQLYHLKSDLAEQKNVAKSNPDKVQELQALLDEFRADIAKNSRAVGVAEDSRTLVPRPGVEGEEGYIPTLLLP